MSAWKPVERAYSLWVGAAREKRGSAAGLARALEAYLRKAHGLGPDGDVRGLGVETALTGRTIGRWERGTAEKPQPQYPADSWSRRALQAVVTELVPAPPVEMEWASFHEVCDAFVADRLDRIDRGAGTLGSYAATERNKERRHFLATWPASAKELNPISLGLGSWAFEGALPPYVPRTADEQLLRRLEDPGVTTVTGAPKSGKSRSILEVLQRHYPDALTWWVNPSTTVLPLVVEYAKRAKGSERPDFVVLDDAGLMGLDPKNGLTAQRLHELAAASVRLILIIHNHTIAEWEHRLTNRASSFASSSLGVSRELMDRLGNRVTYASVLDDRETAAAARTYDNANERVKSFDLTRLAETLAGVETLRKQATHMLETSFSVEAALLEAAIDVSIALPQGATVDVLQVLAAAHHKRRQPNRPWRIERFDDALNTLTTGITTGSPHSILIADDKGTYRLLDALVPELQHADRDIVESISDMNVAGCSTTMMLFNCGYWFWMTGKQFKKVELAWRKAAGDIDSAEAAYLRDDEVGRIAAVLGLSALFAETGNKAEEREWLEKAAAVGDGRSMERLAHIANAAGDIDGARKWWEKAAEAGEPLAQRNLGVLAHLQGDVKEARRWWKKAARGGNISAMGHLGTLADSAGDSEGAREWWEKAANAGYVNAQCNLGALLDKAGDSKGAREWWERAVRNGSTGAMNELGRLAYEVEDIAGARKWWAEAAKAGDSDAQYNLGLLLYGVGDIDGARKWWEEAAKAGVPDAQYNLGVLRDADDAENE